MFCVQDVMTDETADLDAQAHQDSTVYLCGKSETNYISTGQHYDETGEKTISCGHTLLAYR